MKNMRCERNMGNRIGLAALLMIGLLSGQALAEDLVITSFTGNGVVSWTYPTNGIQEYRVEWASDLINGRWTDLEQGFRGVVPTGGTMSAQVPMFYRIRSLGPAPTDMAYIPAGSFTMGNCMDPGEGYSDELATHSVYVSPFYMDRYEVSKAKWDEVYAWATGHGYTFTNAGSGKATNHPVQAVNWFDCVKWCNARSEKEVRTPAYYTSATLDPTNIYRTGQVVVQTNWVRWDTGYRLPTEAEWEKAARGGVANHRFPWSDTDNIDFKRANYYSYWSGGVPYFSYDQATVGGYHPTYTNGAMPYTSPVGSFAANGYGLYDTAGNVWEWCWDWYSSSYYSSSPETNPRGDGSGSYRVYRGGSWSDHAHHCRVAIRLYITPGLESNLIGFRAVLPPGQ